MVKIALFVALLAFVWFMIVRPLLKGQDDKHNHTKKSSKHKQIQSEEMCECGVCGTFCAINEGIRQNKEFFCSKQCYEKFIEFKKQD